MIKYIIHRPIAVSMIILAIVIVSIVSLMHIPVSLMPNIDIPQITVQIDMPGYSVQEIENKIVTPLREQLSQVDGVKNIRSDARMDMGSIRLRFEPGSNIDLAFINVNEKVDMAMGGMPKGMDRPKVIKASALDIPAFYIDLSLKKDGRNLPGSTDFDQLSDFTRNVLCHRLEQIPSVAMIDMSGMTSSEILCIPDENKMQSLGITEADLQNALSQNNIQLEALTVTDGAFRYRIHFDSQLLTIEDVRNIYINHDGRILQMKDLCDIREHTAMRKNIDRHDGKNCISLAVIKQSDAQMSDLKNDLSSVIKSLRKDYPEINFDITRDQTELLSYSIDNLQWNLLAAILFTCVVLMFFLKDWRMAILVAMSIPLSLIITLFCFYVIGISINVISLSGLILGVGMIVDNSIIVIDNILLKLRSGLPLIDAIAQGTREVFSSMLSSVLTTCSVFIPLIFIGGTAGSLFFDQSVGVTIALFASLLIAVVVLPVYFYMTYKKVHNISQKSTRNSQKLIHGYEKISGWMFRHARLCMILFLLCIPGVIVAYLLIEKRQLPDIEYSDGMMHVDWNENISVEESDRRVCNLMDKWHKRILTSTQMTGNQDYLLSHTRDITSSEALVYLKCESVKRYRKLQDSLKNSVLSIYPEATVSFAPSGNLFNMIFSTDEPDLQINLQTIDGKRPAVGQVEDVVDELRKNFPHVDIPSVVTENNLQLVADVEQMASYDITYDQLENYLEQLLGKNSVLQISHGSESVPVIIGGCRKDRNAILQSSITNAHGVSIPLNYIVKERVVNDYKHLYGNESGAFYPIVIQASDSQIKSIVKFINQNGNWNKQFNITTSGSYFSSQKAVWQLVLILVVSVLLLFFILAAEFESLLQPLIILSEIFIDVFVVICCFGILGESLNMMSMIGLILMSGIVINDSILKVDTINYHLRQGLPLLRSVLQASHERLIPILMTSLTTIFSLLPFLSRGSIGADMQFPLSLTIMIGLTAGTFVSIFFVPLAYYIVYNLKSKK